MGIQMDLFQPVIIKKTSLVAESPRRAFYRLSLELEFGHYIIRKKSGAGVTVLDQREWVFESLEVAEKKYDQRVRQKLNQNRLSLRKYTQSLTEA